jgi:hypothetical protein
MQRVSCTAVRNETYSAKDLRDAIARCKEPLFARDRPTLELKGKLRKANRKPQQMSFAIRMNEAEYKIAMKNLTKSGSKADGQDDECDSNATDAISEQADDNDTFEEDPKDDDEDVGNKQGVKEDDQTLLDENMENNTAPQNDVSNASDLPLVTANTLPDHGAACQYKATKEDNAGTVNPRADKEDEPDRREDETKEDSASKEALENAGGPPLAISHKGNSY